MTGVVSRYEFEALPELGAGYQSEFEGDPESEQFFGALTNLARRGVGWLTAPGSPQRQAALTLARQAMNQGLPALTQLDARLHGAAISDIEMSDTIFHVPVRAGPGVH